MARVLRWSLLVPVLVSACGEKDEFVVPDPPPVGFQIQLAPVTIPPGKDVEFCSYFNLDLREDLAAEGKDFILKDLIATGIDARAEEIAVNRIEVKGAPGLHHIQVLAMQNDLEDVPDKHIFECAVDLFGGPLTGDVDPIFFTQVNDIDVNYEAGVGRVLKRVKDKDDDTKSRGTQLLYNFHYLNPTEKPLVAEVVVNLHVVPRETIVHPVRSAWWNYLYFEATSGTPTGIDAHGSFLVDVNLIGITSHQHETGTLFNFEIEGEKIYENKDWAEPHYQTFPNGKRLLTKDTPINFRCEWNNPFASSRYFGLQADDEMCTAIVEYYPVNEAEAEALLEQQRMQNEMNMRGPFEGDAITLEKFLPFPEELIQMVSDDPDNAWEILDRDIVCGIGVNLKQMERQYGSSPDVLASLQSLLEFLTPVCRL